MAPISGSVRIRAKKSIDLTNDVITIKLTEKNKVVVPHYYIICLEILRQLLYYIFIVILYFPQYILDPDDVCVSQL